MRDGEHVQASVANDDLSKGRQRARQDRDSRLATLRRECERILFPGCVLHGEAGLDLLARQAFPVAVVNLTESVTQSRLEATSGGDDPGRFDGTREGLLQIALML
jgi:hypothetical protein